MLGRPATTLFQIVLTSWPREFTAPRPVTTTRFVFIDVYPKEATKTVALIEFEWAFGILRGQKRTLPRINTKNEKFVSFVVRN
jgi:hypothetical protein